MLDASVPGHVSTWGKLSPSKEVGDLLKRELYFTVRLIRQAITSFSDEFSKSVLTFNAKDDLGRLLVVMHAQIECALATNPDILRDVVTTVGEGASVDHAASTNSSILKLSGCSLFAPLFDGSRWGHQFFCTPGQ